ncbi:MAG: plasmid stabilization protein [Sphingomonadales bacterium]|jgi:hypothetical protein|nr:plasmid stabilization protein [Sphingomonadales bacterium]MBK9003218.1 plasmid stabilization protein [Sphingomonadales bacterium]MBK9268465.1 plasmid stabilization protein [Sphingomonadales bacterium]MBP6433711.1 hypothetical protein [Sphingorhabdus sp.]
MTAPQLSVRSAKARDLAHQLSAKEKRPIHAIVEDALVEYAKRHPKEDGAAFLRRVHKIGEGVEGLDETITEMQDFIDAQRKPHPGIDL